MNTYLAYLLSILLSTKVAQQNKQDWIIQHFVCLDFKRVERKTINDLAQSKLNDLLNTGYWSHTNSNGCDFKCRTAPYLNYYSWIGENLYRGVCDKQTAYRLWRESPTHLEILNHPCTHQVLLIEEYAPGKCYMVLEKGIVIGS
jgi:hypothetical protein